MADCYKLLEKFTHFLDGDLKGAEKEKFQEHVDGCQDCGSRLSQTRKIINNLSALPKYKTSPTFEIVLRSKLRSELSKRSIYSHFFLPEKWSQIAVYATAVVLLISTGIFIDRSLVKQPAQPLIIQPLSETTTLPVRNRTSESQKFVMKNYVMEQYPVTVQSDMTESSHQPLSSPDAQTLVTDSIPETKMVFETRPIIQPANALVRF